MRGFRLGSIILLMLAQLSMPRMVRAQEVGHVARLAEIQEGKTVFVDFTQRATLFDEAINNARFAQKKGGFLDRDLVQVKRGVWLDLRITRPNFASRQVFSSDAGLLASPRLEAPHLDSIMVPLPQEGIFRVLSETGGVEALRGVDLLLTKGALFFELLNGDVTMRAAGTNMHITSTEIFLMVDTTEAEGTLYLYEGRMSFPEYPALAVQPHELWQLRAGQPPVLLSLSPAHARQWDDLTRFHRKQLWRKPFLKGAGARLGVGVLAAGAGVGLYCILSGNCGGGGDDGGSNGGLIDVVINIPD